MRWLFRHAPGYVVYIDESGSFELRLGRTDAIAALVVPRRAVSRVSRFVRRIESCAEVDERIRGEVKGSHLRPERFPGIVRFVRRHRLRLSPFVGLQAVASVKEKGLHAEASKLRALVEGTARESEGLALAAAFDRLGPEDRYYCRFAYDLITRGLVRDFVRAGRWPIEVVYDPKLGGNYDGVLRFAINSAFTELHLDHVISPLDALLGDGRNPWVVRPAESGDREGIALVDWLLYPMAVVHREDVAREHRGAYAAICDLYQRAGVVVYATGGDDIQVPAHLPLRT